MGSRRKFDRRQLRSTPPQREGEKIVVLDPSRRTSRKPAPLPPPKPRKAPIPATSKFRRTLAKLMAFLFRGSRGDGSKSRGNTRSGKRRA
jgi:hypothetical protein